MLLIAFTPVSIGAGIPLGLCVASRSTRLSPRGHFAGIAAVLDVAPGRTLRFDRLLAVALVILAVAVALVVAVGWPRGGGFLSFKGRLRLGVDKFDFHLLALGDLQTSFFQGIGCSILGVVGNQGGFLAIFLVNGIVRVGSSTRVAGAVAATCPGGYSLLRGCCPLALGCAFFRNNLSFHHFVSSCVNSLLRSLLRSGLATSLASKSLSLRFSGSLGTVCGRGSLLGNWEAGAGRGRRPREASSSCAGRTDDGDDGTCRK